MVDLEQIILTPTQSNKEGESASGGRIAVLLNNSIFCSLLAVIALTAIPYGTVEPWWQAVFKCAIFGLSILWVIEGFLTGHWFVRQHRLLIPLLVLVAFAVIQITLPFRSAGGNSHAFSNRISYSPYDTKLIAELLLALVCAMGLLLRYTNTRRRLTTLVYVVIGIGLSSTIFGLLRKAFQHGPGFLLPALQPDDGTVQRGIGFAQFINHNHFAFLAEMSFGLVLGLMIIRPIRITRLALGAAVAIPMWVAVVYSNSRAGLASIIGQVLFIGLIGFVVRPGRELLRQTEQDSRRRLSQLFPFLVTRIIVIAAFLVLMVVGIGWIGGERLADHLDSASRELGVPDSDKYTRTYRSTTWPMTWTMIKDHPVTGIGFGAYWIAITRYHQGSGEMTPQQAHNDYLELLASGGLIGFGLALWFLVEFMRAAHGNLRSDDHYLREVRLGALASLLAVSIHSLVDFGLHIPINAAVAVIIIGIVIIPLETAD